MLAPVQAFKVTHPVHLLVRELGRHVECLLVPLDTRLVHRGLGEGLCAERRGEGGASGRVMSARMMDGL